MQIKAWCIKNQGGEAEPFSYERSVYDREVRVKIQYCGIAAGDVQFIDNYWNDTKYPLVPGHEIIGIVDQVGDDVTGSVVGDQVGIGYQQEACFSCEYCRAGVEQFCPQQKVIAVDCFGGLARHIITDYRFVFKLPPALCSASAVPLLSSGLTTYSAIMRAQLPENAVVGVLGIGGLGQLAIQFLNKMGHRVYAFSHSARKKATVSQLGAEFVLTSDREALSRLDFTFDCILSTLYVEYDLDSYLKMLKPQGKFGIVAAPLQRQPVNLGLLYNVAQKTIYGSYVGSRHDMKAMLDFAAKHRIESPVETMQFSKMNEAIRLVKTGTANARLVLEAED